MTTRPMILALLLLATAGLMAADNPVPMGVTIIGGDTATSPVPTNVLINQEFKLTKQHEGPGGTHSWFKLGNMTTSEQMIIIDAANSDAAKPATHTGTMKGIQPGNSWIVAQAKIGAAETTDSKMISIVDFMELRAEVACINLNDTNASFHLLAKRYGTDWPEGIDVKWQRKQTDKEGGDWEDISPTTTFDLHYAEIHDRPTDPGYYLYRCKIYAGDATWTEIPIEYKLVAIRLELLEPASPAELHDHAKNDEFKIACRARIMPKDRDIKWSFSGPNIVKFESGENGVLEDDSDIWRVETNIFRLDPKNDAFSAWETITESLVISVRDAEYDSDIDPKDNETIVANKLTRTLMDGTQKPSRGSDPLAIPMSFDPDDQEGVREELFGNFATKGELKSYAYAESNYINTWGNAIEDGPDQKVGGIKLIYDSVPANDACRASNVRVKKFWWPTQFRNQIYSKGHHAGQDATVHMSAAFAVGQKAPGGSWEALGIDASDMKLGGVIKGTSVEVTFGFTVSGELTGGAGGAGGSGIIGGSAGITVNLNLVPYEDPYYKDGEFKAYPPPGGEYNPAVEVPYSRESHHDPGEDLDLDFSVRSTAGAYVRSDDNDVYAYASSMVNVLNGKGEYFLFEWDAY